MPAPRLRLQPHLRPALRRPALLHRVRRAAAAGPGDPQVLAADAGRQGHPGVRRRLLGTRLHLLGRDRQRRARLDGLQRQRLRGLQPRQQPHHRPARHHPQARGGVEREGADRLAGLAAGRDAPHLGQYREAAAPARLCAAHRLRHRAAALRRLAAGTSAIGKRESRMSGLRAGWPALLLNALVLGLFIWAVEHYWGWGKLLAPWRNLELAVLLLAVCGMLLSYVVRALRIYLAERDIPRGQYLACLRLILINNVVNLLLPARSGEASFPILMKRWFGIDPARATGTLIWLRLLDLHVLATIGAACAAGGWLGASL